MSRDYHTTYDAKLACLKCRKSWRKASHLFVRRAVSCDLRAKLLVCPQCRGRLINMGVDFKAPAQSNRRQWRKVELLVEAGVQFEVRRFTQAEGDMRGPGPRPYVLREVEPFLEERAQEIRRVLGQKRKTEKVARRRERIEERKERLILRRTKVAVE